MKNRNIAAIASALILMLVTVVVDAADGQRTGKVLETMNSGGYTYAKVEGDGETYWVAGVQSAVSVGDEVHFAEQMWMENFHSKSLDRSFSKILFVSSIASGSTSAAATASAHPNHSFARGTNASANEAVTPKSSSFSTPKDGHTIAGIYADKQALNGKSVVVRGEVVKISRNIMSRTWVHIKDGTGEEGSDKIVFRSMSDTVAVGDEVTAQGRLEVDKDFGMGYLYPVIVEDATFSK